MEHEQITYPEALRWLAKKYNIEIVEKELTDEERQEQNERESMFIVNEWAKDYFHNKKHQTVDIIKLNGSIELAPIVGLSDVIVDIVETGATLRENGLSVLEEICPLSARMVVNQVSMRLEAERIRKIINDLKEVVG